MAEKTVQGKNLILDAFLDEASLKRDENRLGDILSVGHALGLQFWTPRWAFHEGQGKNVNITITPDTEWVKYISMMSQDYGLSVECMGTPLLKSRLFDVEDGNKAPYKTKQEVLELTKQAIENADIMGANCLRGFSGYGTIGGDAEEAYKKALDILVDVAGLCCQAGKLYVLEPETGLVGNCADTMIQLAHDADLDNLVFLHDGANVHLQGLNGYEEGFKLLQSGNMVGMHVKCYGEPITTGILPSQEEAMDHHVPVNLDCSGYDRLMERVAHSLTELNAVAQMLGARGFFATLEPHVAGPGQNRGHSTPIGMRFAHDAFVDMLRKHDIGYTHVSYDQFREGVKRK